MEGLEAFQVNPVRGAGVPVSVMMPLDLVSNSGVLNNPDGLKNQLQQLKSGGVDGVMTDVWWGIVERAGPQQYDWGAYLDFVQMCQSIGLHVDFVTSFHQCGGNVGDACDIKLPSFVYEVNNGKREQGRGSKCSIRNNFKSQMTSGTRIVKETVIKNTSRWVWIMNLCFREDLLWTCTKISPRAWCRHSNSTLEIPSNEWKSVLDLQERCAILPIKAPIGHSVALVNSNVTTSICWRC
eukprot:TRINITY_DN2144_c0_g1_i1.p1 TRINITY_DN2144_c0_g1~~TRINITY_DN2144_c0_g1_i1.p1  ORF type:complete len:257 (+),score=27.80 TRINITY_DN2144_c0_g1_i1:58-771(+)